MGGFCLVMDAPKIHPKMRLTISYGACISNVVELTGGWFVLLLILCYLFVSNKFDNYWWSRCLFTALEAVCLVEVW